MQPEAIEEAQAWLRKAQSDLRAIEILIKNSDFPPDIVCYHAQQMAEKALKALLTAYGVPFPKTHDLVFLNHLLPSTIDVGVEPQALAELSYFAVESRYPGEMEEYTHSLAEKLLQQARTAYDTAADLIRKLHPEMAKEDGGKEAGSNQG
jgi:HEPN domain-containing protein